MTRINLFRSTPATLNSIAWGKNFNNTNHNKKNPDKTSTLIFAALLIACSLAVGCSSEKPKTESSANQSPIVPPTPQITTSSVPSATPVQQALKPVHKKVVRKSPPTVTYADDVTGVSFQYPRKYALKTGEAAKELVSSAPIPMDFVQPGGVALAAVELPDSVYPHSDLASASFNVSVNKALTSDQCSEFSVPQPNPSAPTDPTVQATAQLATPPISKSGAGKLMIGDMELVSSETSATEETKAPQEESSKYFHVFQNGACYEFALKIATTKLDAPATTKPSPNQINRDEVFQRLEKILATVKINPVATPEVNAEVKTNPQTTETSAQ
jgi:hypothetical protein